MGVRTLLQLKTQARQLADQVNSNFVTDAELTSFVNLSLAHLHSKQADSGERYNAKNATFLTVSGVDSYPVESDFYKLIDVEKLIQGSNPPRYTTLRFYEFKERNRHRHPYMALNYFGTYRYTLLNNNIMINPTPQEVVTLRYWYEPVFNYLALDTDTYNFLDGWDAYVIYDAAIYMMTKEESDSRQVQAKFQEVKDMIEKTLNKRMTGPRHVVETDVSEDLILWGTGNAIF